MSLFCFCSLILCFVSVHSFSMHESGNQRCKCCWYCVYPFFIEQSFIILGILFCFFFVVVIDLFFFLSLTLLFCFFFVLSLYFTLAISLIIFLIYTQWLSKKNHSYSIIFPTKPIFTWKRDKNGYDQHKSSHAYSGDFIDHNLAL